MHRIALAAIGLAPLTACVQADEGLALDVEWAEEQARKTSTCDKSGCDSDTDTTGGPDLDGVYENYGGLGDGDGCPLLVGVHSAKSSSSPYEVTLGLRLDRDPYSDGSDRTRDDEGGFCEEEEEVMMPAQVVVTGSGSVNITEYVEELGTVFQFRGTLTTTGLEGEARFSYFEELGSGESYQGLQVDHVGEDGTTSAQFDWTGSSQG